MTAYIFIRSNSAIPKRSDAISFIFDKSFSKRRLTGTGYIRDKEGCPVSALFHWAKWQDNPKLARVIENTNIWIVFSPFSVRNIKYSRAVERRAKAAGYEYVIQVNLGNAQGSSAKEPINADRRAFHRTVYFFASRMKGVVCEGPRKRLLSSADYRRKYQSEIRSPFHKRLMKKDLLR